MVNFNGIKLKNRFLISAGALSCGEGYFWQKPLIKLGIIDPSIFGGVVTRTLTPESRQGNFIDPLPSESEFKHFLEMLKAKKRVLRKIPAGWINNFAWWNVGVDYYIREIYPKTEGVSRIVSVGGFVMEDYLQVIRKLNSLDLVALELNISCVNAASVLGKDTSELIKLFTFCKESSAHPLIVKIGPETNYIEVARMAEYCGINAISSINTMPGLIIQDGKSFEGGISGPSLKPISLRIIANLRKAGIFLPIIAGGGIYSWKDCKDFFAVGTDAVSFSSVFMEWNRIWLPTYIVKSHKYFNPH